MFWFFFFGAKEDLNSNNDDRCLRGVDPPIPEQQFHAASVHIKLAGSFIVLHNRILQILLVAYGL